MVWWEAVLSPALQVLFDKLASGDIPNLLRKWDIDDLLLEKLKIAYLTCTVVIDDAEEKQYHNPAIQTWLDMLKDAVYEAEDALDLLATEALRCKQELGHNNQWRSFLSNQNFIEEGMLLKIEYLIDKMEFISKQKDTLGLKSTKMGWNGLIQRLPTTPLVVESCVFGRDGEKEQVIELLLGDDDGKERSGRFFVVPILGMGGIGKTTLAQIVYNDLRIDDIFDVKAWACVSHDFNVMNITKALLESSTCKPCEMLNLELLRSGLRQVLSKKRFLIVLDDVWNEDFAMWNELLIPFAAGNSGSRIIVTTRNEGVLSVMKTLSPYRLKEMSDPACWQLFQCCALEVEGSEKLSSLQEIGGDIVKRCKGLPLAVKMLGGLLASKLDLDYWRSVLNSNLWDLPPNKSVILPSLRLSYHQLPSYLKRCFAYCSIFPKGYEFERKNLVLLWMAEGFLQQRKNLSMEQVGNEYFSELLSRSFFQKSEVTKSRYVMHDLINDLASSVSRTICVRQEHAWKAKHLESFEKTRHLSYIRTKYDVFKKFEPFSECKSIRTFLPLGSVSVSGMEACYITKKVPYDLLPKWRCLRVLSLNGYCITHLPESVSNLRLLRYIDLSYTEIETLPESMTILYNLQTLLLCHCNYLKKLPDNIGRLTNLQLLDISGSGIQEMPVGIEDLIDLHFLPTFVLGKGDHGSGIAENSVSQRFLPEFELGNNGCHIGALRDLAHIQGSLSISNLENVTDVWDARQANLNGKSKINELVLEWTSSLSELQNETVASDVLEMLQPHQDLGKLTVIGYNGVNFPLWIGDSSFSKLVFLSLSDCQRCTFLPSLGCLPLLKELDIKRLSALQNIGMEFYGYGHFASLEILSFKEMMEWQHWLIPEIDRDVELFPSLRELHIYQCPKLRGRLPENLPSLVKLVLSDCEQLSFPLSQIPKLEFLNLRGCNHALLSSNLVIDVIASFELHSISSLTYLPEWLLLCMPRLCWLVITECPDLVNLARYRNGGQCLTSLRQLVIRNCSLLESLFEEDQHLPEKLEYLELDCCQSLKKLPHALNRLTALQEFIITDCPRLKIFPETVFPSNLKGLVIRGCDIDSLPMAMLNSITSLTYLLIGGCLVLSSFPSEGRQLPTTFKQLTIECCPNLEFLPQGMTNNNNTFLELLEIFDCSSITSFPAGHLPNTLKVLTIWNCCNLESLADVASDSMALESLRIGNCTNLVCLPSSLYKLRSLDLLEIEGCPSIISFPRGGLPTNSLERLHIIGCEKLEFLPDFMYRLTSLKDLQLCNCPGITLLPEGGLPINLASLEIKDCKNMVPLVEWGLHRLASLKNLKVYGVCSDGVLSEWLLPSTLSALHIGRLPKLESLSPWLKNLTSLEELKIMECRKLFTLPNEGMPPMLSFLEISKSSELQQFCEKNWSEIDDIPCIVM